MPSSSFPSNVTGVTVDTATNGALSGDGSSGNKLAVGVDGTTIDVNGSNQLEFKSGSDLAVNSIVGTSTAAGIVLPTPTSSDVLGVGPTIFNTGIEGFATFNGPAGVTIRSDVRTAWCLAMISETQPAQLLMYPGEIAAGFSALGQGLGISANTLDGNNFAEMSLIVTGTTAGALIPGDGGACDLSLGQADSPWDAGFFTGAATAGSIVPSATAYASLPTPAANSYPICVVSDSTVTSGTVSAGGGLHVNVIVWTGTLWTVLKNLT